ncbi:hypothetical protein [Sphingomonas sp.]|nr:hypothetical protein [Sphingomonas sp.]MBO9711597.1 hypothetical protein [Sphingomonas sp.]
MPRSLIALIVVVVVLIAGIFFLASRTSHKEPVRTEKAVTLENLAN